MPGVRKVQVVRSQGDKGVTCSIRGRARSSITAGALMNCASCTPWFLAIEAAGLL